MFRLYTLCAIIGVALLILDQAKAQHISLKSGEVISFKDINLPETLMIDTLDGQKKEIKLKDIQSFEFQPSTSVKPFLPRQKSTDQSEVHSALKAFEKRSPFETPKQTFLTWKDHASKGSIDGIASCYTTSRHDKVKKKLRKIKRKQRLAMQEAVNATSFTVGDPLYQGNKAFLEVNWTKGLHSESQVLKLLLEKNQWKIIE